MSDNVVKVPVLSEELIAGSRRKVSPDPTDPRFILIEDRCPATPLDDKDREQHGEEALRGQLQASIGATVVALAYVDPELAEDVIEAFKSVNIIPEDVVFELPELPEEEGPSS